MSSNSSTAGVTINSGAPTTKRGRSKPARDVVECKVDLHELRQLKKSIKKAGPTSLLLSFFIGLFTLCAGQMHDVMNDVDALLNFIQDARHTKPLSGRLVLDLFVLMGLIIGILGTIFSYLINRRDKSEPIDMIDTILSQHGHDPNNNV